MYGRIFEIVNNQKKFNKNDTLDWKIRKLQCTYVVK